MSRVTFVSRVTFLEIATGYSKFARVTCSKIFTGYKEMSRVTFNDFLFLLRQFCDKKVTRDTFLGCHGLLFLILSRVTFDVTG